MTDFDLVAIGGGAGGLAAARAAAERGKRAAIVSEGPIGGDCTWTGCVPSKTLIEAAAQGLSFDDAMARVRQAVLHIGATEDEGVLEREGITVRRGRARLRDAHTVEIDGGPRALTAANIVIATGSTAMVPPVPGLGELAHLTNEDIWELRDRPDRLGVLGGGAIGCELAQAMARLGVAVTVFELEPRLLPHEEPEASAIVRAALEADGVRVLTDTLVNRVRAVGDEGAATVLAGGREIEVDRLLVAVGRTPSTEGLGLDAVGVTLTPSGHVQVDDRLRTTVDNIWAVGDVNGIMALTHAADEQGRLAGWAASGRLLRWRFDPGQVPWTVFTAPELARVGVTEADAPRGSRVAFLPMSENDRAIAAGRTDGFVKLIAAPRPLLRRAGGGRIAGATIVGERAGEMIHEPALLMLMGGFTGRLAQLGHAYPTWSVGIQKCAAQFFQEIEGRRARPAQRG